MSQSVLNFYQHVIIKQPYIYYLHHFFRLYQEVSNRFSFMSLIICFGTSPVSISVVFVWPYPCLFTILESAHMWLSYLAAAWPTAEGSSVQSSAAFINFGLTLQTLRWCQNRLIFFVVVQSLLLCCVLVSINIIFFLRVQDCNRFRTQYTKKTHHFSGISDIL